MTLSQLAVSQSETRKHASKSDFVASCSNFVARIT